MVYSVAKDKRATVVGVWRRGRAGTRLDSMAHVANPAIIPQFEEGQVVGPELR